MAFMDFSKFSSLRLHYRVIEGLLLTALEERFFATLFGVLLWKKRAIITLHTDLYVMLFRY